MGNFLSLARMCKSQWLRLLFELSIERIPGSQLILVRTSQIELYKSRCADIKDRDSCQKDAFLQKSVRPLKAARCPKIQITLSRPNRNASKMVLEKIRHNIGILIPRVYNSWKRAAPAEYNSVKNKKVAGVRERQKAKKPSFTFFRHSFVSRERTEHSFLRCRLFCINQNQIGAVPARFFDAARLFPNKEIIGAAFLTLITRLMGIC